MRREDVVDLFNHRVPQVDHAKVQIIMRFGSSFSVDALIRLEDHYMVARGRESGNQDDGRILFVPYDEIVGMRLERSVKISEVEEWFNDRPKQARRNGDGDQSLIETPVPEVQPQDPAEIARQNLLDRIRAARSVIGKPVK
ncbi:hypothetical protein BH11PLA2_BH11PLA2_05090 [soil metagenome]